MAYPNVSHKKLRGLFDNIMYQKLMKSNIFAFYLSDYDKIGQVGLPGTQSDITFGYYDKEKFTGEMRWYDVKFKSMFGIQLDDIKVNGKSTEACKVVKECLFVVDSGTSHMSMPSAGLRNFVK